MNREKILAIVRIVRNIWIILLYISMSTSTLTSRDFQKKFGAITDKIASGESVQVTRYGRPAYYIIPESPEAKEYFRRVS